MEYTEYMEYTHLYMKYTLKNSLRNFNPPVNVPDLEQLFRGICMCNDT